MSQVSYGTITITDTNDIERIYIEYCRSTSNQLDTSVMPPIVPDITVNWSENTPAWQSGEYIWQRSVVKKSGISDLVYGTPVCLTGAGGRSIEEIKTFYCNYGTGTPAEDYDGWSVVVPEYVETKPYYWIKTVIIYVDDSKEERTYTGNPITIDDADGEIKSLNVELAPIQEGSGTPSPTNIRPISPHTSLPVRDTGVNQWDEEVANGYWDAGTGAFAFSVNWKASKNYIPCFPNTAYHATFVSGTGSVGGLLYYDADKNYTGQYITEGFVKNATFTTPVNAYYMTFYANPSYFNSGISINYPATYTDYHPYTGQTVTVPLNDLYGGSVDVIGGESSEEYTILSTADYDASKYMASSDLVDTNTIRVYLPASQMSKHMKPNATSMITIYSDKLPTYAPDYIYSNDVMGVSENRNLTSNGLWFRINKDLLADQTPAGAKQWLKDNAVTIAYPLATPTPLTTTPRAVTLYKGDNVVSSDGNMTLDYYSIAGRDIQIHLDNGLTEAIAQSVEANSNATEALDKANEANSVAQHANEDAQGAMSQAASNINEVVRLWQAKNTHSKPSAPSSEVTTGSTSTYNSWSNIKPTATDTYRYFYYCDQSKTGGGVCSWSEVIEDTSYLSTYEINATNVRTKNFFKGLDNSYDGFFASGRLTNEGLNTSNAETYLYNARFAATHISLGYNKTPIIDLDGSSGAINIYRFPTIDSSTGLVTAAGELGMRLSATNLAFYKPNTTTPSMLIDTNGIIIGEKQDDSVSDLEKTNYLQLTSSGLSFYGLFNPFSLIPIQRQFGKLLSLGADSNQLGATGQNHLYIDKEQTCLGVGDSATWNNAFMRIGSNAASLVYSNYVETYQGVWNTGETLSINYQLQYLGQSPFSRTDGVVIKLDLPDGTSTTFNGATALIELAGTTYAIQVMGTEQVSGSPLRITTTSSGDNPIGSINITVILTYNATMYGPRYMFGNGGIPYAPYSMTFGNHTIASSTNQIVMGQYNEPLINAQFIIGNGTSDNDRSNLFVIDNDGNLKVTDGFEIVSSNGNSLALNSTGVEVKYQDKTLAKYGATTIFYKPDGSTVAATINSNGINIVKGTIQLGDNFSVTSDGTLHASGADVSGAIKATSLSTGGRTSSTAVTGTYIDAYGAIYGGNNKFTVTKEGALTAEGAVLNNLYFKDQYKTYGFLGWTTSESSGLIGSYEITSDWYEEHASDSTLVLTYAYTNSFSSPFILKKNGNIVPTSINYYQISTSTSINTVTVTINLTTVGVDDGDEFSVYATNKNNTHYYIALNGYDDSYKYGQGSFSCGESCEASGIFSTAIGRSVKVTGIGSFGQGRGHKVTGPYCSATGVNNTVNTYFSHAEGGYNLIDEEANIAHAEGWHTTITAEGNGAHTEGGYTTATAQSAHAEGDYTLASGAESHAGGYYTIAQGMCQTAIGAFNEAIGTPNSVPDRTVPVFIIGNGTSEDSRSNALTVDWNGNVTANDYYSKITTLNLGTYVATGFISSSCGAIGFSIPTGRVFPSGTTINKITFSVTARVSKGTSAANAGIYCITSATDGGAGSINYNSTASTKFYNASGVQKTLTTSITTIGLYGGTNIYIYWNGDNYLFGANSLYINNKPVVLTLTGINVTFNIPT